MVSKESQMLEEMIDKRIDQILEEEEDINTLYQEVFTLLNEDIVNTKVLVNNNFIDRLLEELTDRVVEDNINNISKIDEIAKVIGKSNKIDLTQTQFKDKYNKIKKEKSKESDEIIETEPLNKWFKENIEEINIVRSSDSNVDTKYQFKFQGYHKYIETNNEYKSPEHMMDEIFDLTTKRVEKPEMDLEPFNQWYEFITYYINDMCEEKVYKGACTEAIEDIKMKIETSSIYMEKEQIEKENIYYNEEENKLYVPNEIIKHIVEEKHNQNLRTIQSELNNRDVTNGGISKRVMINGNKYRCWVFPGSFCEFGIIKEKEEDIMNTF